MQQWKLPQQMYQLQCMHCAIRPLFPLIRWHWSWVRRMVASVPLSHRPLEFHCCSQRFPRWTHLSGIKIARNERKREKKIQIKIRGKCVCPFKWREHISSDDDECQNAKFDKNNGRSVENKLGYPLVQGIPLMLLPALLYIFLTFIAFRLPSQQTIHRKTRSFVLDTTLLTRMPGAHAHSDSSREFVLNEKTLLITHLRTFSQ